jgi:malate dehydrogenase
MRVALAGYRDLHAFGHERARDREADAARSAGDNRDLPAYRFHCCLVVCRDAVFEPRAHSTRIVHRMQEVAIIGAGELGGAIAHVLARRDIARSIRLVDDAGQVAAGKALDISQASPVEGFATQLLGTAEIESAAGASVIVMADRVGGSEWQGDEAAQLARRIMRMAPRAVVICAGALQQDVVDRAVRELHLDRHRILGSAPEALAAGARALVALAVSGSPRDVGLTMLGVPPAHAVFPWEEATIGGFALTRRLDEPTRRRVAARVAASWPPGPHALAAAATAVVDAIVGRSRRVLSCFVGPEMSAGERTRTAALPVLMNGSGISDVVVPILTAVERTALENAMAV